MLNNKTFLDLTHGQAVDYLISCPSRLEIMVSRMVIRTQSGRKTSSSFAQITPASSSFSKNKNQISKSYPET